MHKPLITVIIPVYNSEKTISCCLDSVLRQTYSNYDILIINDGSTDKTREIIKNYEKDFSNIQVKDISNHGIGYVRQLGVSLAKGKYILFVDSDDWIENSMLEILYNNIEKTKCLISNCSFWVESNKGSNIIRLVNDSRKILNIENVLNSYFTRQFRGGLWCYLFDKDLFNNFSFPQDCCLGEDFTAIMYVFGKVDQIAVSALPQYHYMQNSSSLSHQGFTKFHRNSYYNFKKLKMHLLKKYPEKRENIICSFIINELGILTAMCKNDIYDYTIINEIKRNVKKYFFLFMKNKSLLLVYKISIFVLYLNTKAFLIGYRIIYKNIKSLDMNTINKGIRRKNV